MEKSGLTVAEVSQAVKKYLDNVNREIEDLQKKTEEYSLEILKEEKEEKEPEIVKVAFPKLNKNCTLADNRKMAKKYGVNVTRCVVAKTVTVSPAEYREITKSLMDDRPEMWEGMGGISIDDKYLEGIKPATDEYYQAFADHGVTEVIKLTDGDNTLYVDPEGYNYARYAGEKVED